MNALRRLSLTVRDLHTCPILFQEKAHSLKGKKHSSQLWLSRQIKDPYVERAKQENYRCRSAFKLLEIDERFNLLKPGHIVIDCGAAPGSWTQVAVKKTNADGKTNDPMGTVLAIDKLSIYPIEGASILSRMDFTNSLSQIELLKLLNNKKADIVLSDMAPNATGVKHLDHENIIKLVYSAMRFAMQVTKTGGLFLCKLWDGEMSQQLQKDLLRFYKTVKIIRPQATRSESAEQFFLAKDFRGIKSTASSTM
nr:rRNA methyltransferase 2, mitochondrial [Nomia melanderi]